jgi:ribosomal protein S18 acetylase RimI-like enzyme
LCDLDPFAALDRDQDRAMQYEISGTGSGGADQRALLCAQLWQRGGDGDVAAIERVLAADPGAPPPPFLSGPEGSRLTCALGERDAEEVAALLDGAYWNRGFSRAEVAASHLGSTAWVGARDAQGALIASARAVGDRVKSAWIYDVIVAPAWRGRGLGLAVVRLLMDHPAVRGTRRLYLKTRDAQSLYRKLGFIDESEMPPQGFTSSTMLLDRPRA